jgi:hypothetical protein
MLNSPISIEASPVTGPVTGSINIRPLVVYACYVFLLDGSGVTVGCRLPEEPWLM